EQPGKALGSAPNLGGSTLRLMLVTPLPIKTLLRFVQPAKVPIAMMLTLSGMVTLVSPLFWKPPIPVTGSPLIVAGMITAPPGPVYPVMSTVPSSLVHVSYWAFAERGTAKSKSGSANRAVRRRARRRNVKRNLVEADARRTADNSSW